MKITILKYPQKQKYVFYYQILTNVIWYAFDMEKNVITCDWEYEKKITDIYQYKYFKKYLKKGYKTHPLPENIDTRTREFLQQTVLGERYYFVRETNHDDKTYIAVLGLSKIDNQYQIITFSDYEDQPAFSTMEEFMAGFIRYSAETEIPAGINYKFSFLLTILSVLGFKQAPLTKLLTLATGKEFDSSKEKNAPLYKSVQYSSAEEEQFVKTNFFKENRIIKTITFYVENKQIKKKSAIFNAFKNDKEFIAAEKSAKLRLKDNKIFSPPVSHENFWKKYTLNLSVPEKYSFPEIKKIEIPLLRLTMLRDELTIYDFSKKIIEAGFYFFANTESGPQQWLVAFVGLIDPSSDNFCFSNICSLQQLNNEMKVASFIELKYDDDIKSHFAKLKRKYLENGLNPVSPQQIYSQITGLSFNKLSKEQVLHCFAEEIDGYFNVIQCYPHYAFVISPEAGTYYLQFFSNDSERETWLKNYNISNDRIEKEQQKKAIELINNVNQFYDNCNLRQAILNHPLLSDKKNIDFNFNKNLRKTRFNLHQSDKIIQGDYTLSLSDSLWIKGQFIVEGTLYITKQRTDQEFDSSVTDAFIVIEGGLKATNLVVEGGFELFIVEKPIEISGIAVCCYTNEHIICHEHSKAHILMHTSKNVFDLNSPFQYDYQINNFSEAIIDKSILTSNSFGWIGYDYAKIFNILSSGKPLLSDNFLSVEVDKIEASIYHFENRMKDWGYFYHDLAGCRKVQVMYDNELVGSPMIIEGGDWVVYDHRGKSGTYGISHEDWSITPVKLKHPEKFQIDYKQKPVKLSVSAETLLSRYEWIAMLFINWAHRVEVSPFSCWENQKAINSDYEKEKPVFKHDPCLAMYWLLHFGFSADERYQEVIEIINRYQLQKELNEITGAIHFFEKRDVFYDLSISNNCTDKQELKQLFLKRRAYLIWNTQSYLFGGGSEALEKWWLSILVYPKAEQYLILRIQWLKNNLEKFNKWNEFNALFKKNKHEQIPLLSYVRACNPTEKQRNRYADKTVDELITCFHLFKGKNETEFAQAMLWEIKDIIRDKKIYKKCVGLYYEGATSNNHYKEIMSVLGLNIELTEVKADLGALKKIAEMLDSASAEKQASLRKQIDTILKKIDPDLLFLLIDNIDNRDVSIVAFCYLYTHDIPNKEKPLTRLFMKLALSSSEMIRLFSKGYLEPIKNNNDANFSLIKKWITLPPEKFSNEYESEMAREACTMFFIKALQIPAVFSFIIEILQQQSSRIPGLASAIFNNLFTEDKDNDTFPLSKLSKKQLERVLEETIEFIDRNHQSDLDAAYEGLAVLYNCSQPRAKQWILRTLNNPKLETYFSSKFIGYENLYEEIKSDLERALNSIDFPTRIVYLENCEKKPTKFIRVVFAQRALDVTKGKKGSEVNIKSCYFETAEEAKNKGEELIEKYLKKGFVRIPEHKSSR